MALAPSLNSTATVAMMVNGKPIVINIDGANAPVTAGNFVDLVERGVYDGTAFHRVVKSPQPFVVQGGDPQSKDPAVPIANLGTGGFIDPATNQARNIPLEIKPQGASQPIYGQTFQQAGITQAPVLNHKQGTIAMARASAPDSASSQFYFALQNLPSLDGNYAAFGNVIQGFDVVSAVNQGDRISVARVVGGDVPGRTTVLSSNLPGLNAALNFANAVLWFSPFANGTDGPDTITAPADLLSQAQGGIRGLGGNDVLTGATDTTNVLWGNQGDDTLIGGNAPDYLQGGRDNDRINGNDGNDILNGNLGNDVVFGGLGDDIMIRGGRGDDQLFGDEGNDVLSGDFGVDTLTGGSGADWFILRTETAAAGQPGDVIVDLNPAEGDRIGVVGQLALTDLTFTATGGGVTISQGGLALGVVNGGTIDAVRAATSIVSPSDAVLRL